MPDRNKLKKIRLSVEESLKTLDDPKLSVKQVKDVLKVILLAYNETDCRLQELEREVILSESFVTDKEIPTRLG